MCEEEVDPLYLCMVTCMNRCVGGYQVDGTVIPDLAH